MKIPPIIHQVYEDPSGPSADLLAISKTWQEHHPEWEHVFWNREKIASFLQTHFPGYIPLYNSFSRHIHRWDFIRYLILYHFGGLYIDMDYECLEPVDAVLSGMDCCFGLEPDTHATWHNKTYIVGNAFIASVPQHFFLKSIIDTIHDNSEQIRSYTTEYSVLDTTGPFLVTNLYHQCSRKKEVDLIPSELVTPLTINEVIDLTKGNVTKEIELKIEKAYAIHYFMGSWKIS